LKFSVMLPSLEARAWEDAAWGSLTG